MQSGWGCRSFAVWGREDLSLWRGTGGGCSVWKRHWKLGRDPFVGAGTPYVSVAPHAEAVARLVDTIETGQRRAVLRAGAGLGKSSVLARALAETRSPWRRAVFLSSPSDGAGLLA